MIVPGDRLLFWAAGVGVPLAAVAGWWPAATPWCTVALLAFVVLALADASRAPARLGALAVELPPVVRLTRERAGTIPLTLHRVPRALGWVRLGLPFPGELSSPHETMRLDLPAEGGDVGWEWPCTPRRRGVYAVSPVYVECASPWGLWLWRQSLPARVEVRVYPNLLGERRRLAAIFLNRGAFGLHAQRQVGKGRDFEKLREYLPGDGFDEIHWKATARRGRPITKVFQIERTQEVYVVLDGSRLSGRPVLAPGEDGRLIEMTELERFVTAALILGLVAERQGDLFGVMAFSDQVDRFVRARNGRAHYGACRDALFALHPRPVTPDFGEIFAFLRVRLRRRALLVFLANLDDPLLAEGFARHVELIRGQHLVLANMVRPPGVAPAFSAPDASTAEDVYERLGGHLRWHRLRQLQRVLGHRGVQFNLVDNESLCVELVSQYLAIKQRQLL